MAIESSRSVVIERVGLRNGASGFAACVPRRQTAGKCTERNTSDQLFSRTRESAICGAASAGPKNAGSVQTHREAGVAAQSANRVSRKAAGCRSGRDEEAWRFDEAFAFNW